MQLAVTFMTIVLSIALAAEASPVQAATSPSRRASDNEYCQQLLNICAASPNALSDPWSVKACLFGAACFDPVDDFLAAIAASKHMPTHTSQSEPRVSQNVFNSISTNGKVITQQNFIDGVFGTLQTTNGPFPDVAAVKVAFGRLTDWTAFCNGQGIPFTNFADYYQFSSTASSAGCGGPPAPVQLTTITLPPTSTQHSVRPTSTLRVHSTTAVVSPMPVRPAGVRDASCNKMFSTCVAQVNKAASDAWSHSACLFAVTCSEGQGTVDGFLQALLLAKTNSRINISSKTETRLSTTTMMSISTDGKSITQQNWIDGYYSLLSSLGGPFPASNDVVIKGFDPVRAWAGFCKGGIPFKNVADYFQFSSSISGNNASC